MESITDIVMGATYTDVISGFTGVCTGRTDYINGCVQACLEGKPSDEGKKPEYTWIDVQRLRRVGTTVVGLPVPRLSGGPRENTPTGPGR